MRHWCVLALALFVGPGCTAQRLQRSTINQATTLTDLQYQQVLSNIAMFSENPSAMPWHVNLRDGSAQVADAGSAMMGGVLTHTSSAMPSLLGSRTVVEQWGMTPITDDTELRLLRIAYRRVVGLNDSLSDEGNELANDLAHQLKQQTTDFNEFQEEIDQAFVDGRNRFRNMKVRELASLTGKSSIARLAIDGLPDATKALIPDILYPYRYIIDGYESDELLLNEVKDLQGQPLTFFQYIERALSVVNERIILEGEVLGDRTSMDWQGRPKIYPFNNYEVDPNIKNEYEEYVNIVTPFAAELRRQVKEVHKDLEEIRNTGWYHVGCEKDVPKDACYVGHYRDRYAWVCPDGREGLTQFTLKVLGITSLIKDPTIFTTPGPRFTPASSFPSH